jgi:hypothetical protein
VDWDSLSLGSLGLGGTKRVVRFVHQKASSEIQSMLMVPTFRFGFRLHSENTGAAKLELFVEG